MWLDAGIDRCLEQPKIEDALREKLKDFQQEEIQPFDDEEEPEYDSPNGSVWIVAVDHAGRVSVLETPNIHPALLDNGPEAEYLGLPPDVDDMDPGVYRWTCSYHTHIDRESGHVDDYDFEIEESVLLWSPDNA
ncbi:hypothetical protein POP15_281 [Pectobacterium phage POP15]|nr:hypothetical protein POP15_281 [Pectobacterium phage POP15]